MPSEGKTLGWEDEAVAPSFVLSGMTAGEGGV